MNIFVTDYDPKIAAQNLCDSHVVKMVLESAQLLCTYLHKQGIETPYKPTHINHPCALWLEKSEYNVRWLLKHFFFLLEEYKFRYNKNHKCQELGSLFISNFYQLFVASKYIKNKDYSPFADMNIIPEKFCLCMPDEFKADCPIKSYRNYYISKQYTMKKDMRWTKRNSPDWFKKIELLDISFYKGK